MVEGEAGTRNHCKQEITLRKRTFRRVIICSYHHPLHHHQKTLLTSEGEGMGDGEGMGVGREWEKGEKMKHSEDGG